MFGTSIPTRASGTVTILICLIACAAAPVYGQSEDEVRAWFQRAWDESIELPALTGYGIVFHIEYPPRHTDAQLVALKREAEGKPDHPNWQEVRAEERRRRQPADASRQMIWSDDSGRWRYSKSYLDSISDAPAYVDAAIAGDVMWQMTESELHIAATKQGTATGTHGDPRTHITTMQAYIRRLFFGGLGEGASVGYAPTGEVMIRPEGGWGTYAGHPEYGRLRYEGTWDREAGRGFVTALIIDQAPESFAESIGRRFDFANWRYDEVSERWIAGTATETTPVGVVENRLVLEEVKLVSAAEFDLLVATPPTSGEDPVRGAVSFRSLYDHRPAALKQYEVTTDRALAGPTDLPGASSFRRWRWAGWIIAAGLIALFVGLRIRRAHL